jgi:hypothetical protein
VREIEDELKNTIKKSNNDTEKLSKEFGISKINSEYLIKNYLSDYIFKNKIHSKDRHIILIKITKVDITKRGLQTYFLSSLKDTIFSFHNFIGMGTKNFIFYKGSN